MEKNEKIKIDKRDRKILALLDFNARISNAEIARKLRISKEAVLYRIKNLEARGIIKQYYAIINPSKLGYYYCRLALKLQNLTQKIEKDMLEWLKQNKKVAYLGICEGYYDLAIGYWAKDVFEFENFVDTFVNKFSKYILEKEISIGTKVWQFPFSFLNGQTRKKMITGGKVEEEKIDNRDRKILVELTKNCRQSYEEIGSKLRLSGKAVKYRIKELIRKGIIVGFRTWIDYAKFGFMNTKVFLLLKDVDKEKMENFISYLSNLKNIIYITKSVGRYDLEFEILTKSRTEFYEIMKKIREENEEIKSYISLIFVKEIISRFIPLME